MTKKHYFRLGILAVMGAAAVAACRSDNGSSGTGGTGGSGATGGSGTGGTAGSGTGGAGGATGGSGGATGGSGGTAGATGGSGGTAGGTGGSAGDASACTGQAATIVDVNNGTVGKGIDVELTDVVATSQKFLVSNSNTTHSCLWGAFVSDQVATAAEYTGVLIISYGAPNVSNDAGGYAPCQSGTDGIPDDIKPGDKLHIYAKTDAYTPGGANGCSGDVPEVQLRVFQSCPVENKGSAAVPAPKVLDTTTADTIAAGTDAATINKWAGILVSLQGVTGAAADGGGVVGQYGAIKFTETNLEAHDKLYYYDLSGGGPKGSGKGWVYANATSFSNMTGIIYHDYCTWSLNPRDKCNDVTPPSDDCSTPDASTD